MSLETATYIASLVVTNPAGGDEKSTADDHLRLIKACLKRTFPLIDGAISLSSAQFMYAADLSASVQLQLNQLRDGTATAANAVNARYANSASVANNTLALGGFSASFYPRVNFANTFSTVQYLGGQEAFRLTHGANHYFSWFNAANTTRLAYVQHVNDGANSYFRIQTDEGGHFWRLGPGAGITIDDIYSVWHQGNDGANSGLDADTVDGYHGSTAVSALTAAIRDSNAYLWAAYFNQSSGNNENPTVSQVMVTNGSDNFLRKSSLASFGSQMVARNISSKSGTAKTLSSSAPSGGSDGDIWYQV